MVLSSVSNWLGAPDGKQLVPTSTFVVLMALLGVASTAVSILAALRSVHSVRQPSDGQEVQQKPTAAASTAKWWACGFLAYALMPVLATPADTLAEIYFDKDGSKYSNGECADSVLYRIGNSWSGLFSTLTLVYFAVAARTLLMLMHEATGTRYRGVGEKTAGLMYTSPLLQSSEKHERIAQLHQRIAFQNKVSDSSPS